MALQFNKRPHQPRVKHPDVGQQLHTHLFAIIGPRAELHDASLLIKREVLDIDLARGLVDGRWFPFDLAVGKEGRLGGQSHLKVAVST